MRLAWFAPQPDDAVPALRRTHQVDCFDAESAHDFVWRHFRAPYDLTIFELADTPRHDFVWAYLFHYPGVVILRAASLQHSRSRWLTRRHRRQDLRLERAFGGPDLLRAPVLASRLVVVAEPALAAQIEERFAGVEARVVPVAATASPTAASDGTLRFRHLATDPDLVERAARRARDAGTPVTLAAGVDDLRQGDVVIALEWPAAAPSVTALRAMAAGLPAIVVETEAVATWPTLDPQTWQTRAYLTTERPVAISLDPRDEEHSLMLAMRRLATDTTLRTSLGDAAKAWAAVHASASAAAEAWESVLLDAQQAAPALTAAALPTHLTEDGSSSARAVLDEFGVAVDFLVADRRRTDNGGQA